jgi:hypothetical protein
MLWGEELEEAQNLQILIRQFEYVETCSKSWWIQQTMNYIFKINCNLEWEYIKIISNKAQVFKYKNNTDQEN